MDGSALRASGLPRMLVARTVAGSLLALAIVGALGLPARGGSTGSSQMRVVGKLPILWPKGEVRVSSTGRAPISLVLDARGRRAYQLFDLCCTPHLPERIGIRSFDLDTLRPLRYATFEGQPWSVNDEWLVALDEERRRLFVPTLVNPLGVQEISGVAVVDLERFDRGGAFVAKRIGVPALHSDVGTMHLYGLNYFRDPSSGAGKLVLLFDKPGAVVVMVQWDVEKGTADWKYPPTACRQGWLLGGKLATPVWRSMRGPYIYATCIVDASRSAVLRVLLGKDGTPAGEEALLGPGARGALFDPGSDRILMLREREGWTAWVADGPTLSFVGAIGLTQTSSDLLSVGLDTASGRFYVLAQNGLLSGNDALGRRAVVVPGGLMLADARLTPAPQALLFPEYSYPGRLRIWVDPSAPGRPRRVFVRRGTEGTEGGVTYPEGQEVEDLYPPEDFYLVIRDDVPASRQPTLRDHDRLTADRPEEDGMTGAAFDGQGSAYGSRLRLVGGVDAATRNGVSDFSSAPPSGEPLCWPTDREFLAGHVEDAHLSSLLASATAGYLDADPSTKIDVERPVTRCQPRGIPQKVGEASIPWPFAALDGVLGRPWPFGQAECVGDKVGREEGKDSGGYPVPNDLYAQAGCKQGDQRVSAEAGGAPLALGGVRVAESFSSVKVHRHAGGVHVTAEAVAREIEFPGLLRIESVRTIAVSEAAGRTGTAKTRFERVVCGIYSRAGEVPGCVEGNRLDQAIAEINARVLGTRGRIWLPEPDREFARGTPRGYAAGIRRDQNEALTAALLESDYRLEVPGLVFVLYRDAPRGAGRQVLMLGGVRASTTYGIFLLPKGVDFPPLPAPEPAPPSAPVGPLPTIGPAPGGPQVLPAVGAPPALERVRAFLFRSLREGTLASAVWLAIGLPFFLALRREAFARSFPREG